MNNVETKIPTFIYERSKVNGFDFYRYLHIHGGAGIKNPYKTKKFRSGGEYDYVLFYASPDEMNGCNICHLKWCEEKGIVFGEGSTIEEAYTDYLSKIIES